MRVRRWGVEYNIPRIKSWPKERPGIVPLTQEQESQESPEKATGNKVSGNIEK